MRPKAQDGGVAGGAGRPAQQDVALRIVTEQALRRECAAVDVTGEVTQGGAPPAHGLELDVPSGGGGQGAARIGRECGVKAGVLVF